MRILLRILSIILGAIAIPFAIVGFPCIWASERIMNTIDNLWHWYHTRPIKPLVKETKSIEEVVLKPQDNPTFIPNNSYRRKRR